MNRNSPTGNPRLALLICAICVVLKFEPIKWDDPSKVSKAKDIKWKRKGDCWDGSQIPGWQYIILIKWINNKSKAMEMPAAGEISLKSAFLLRFSWNKYCSYVYLALKTYFQDFPWNFMGDVNFWFEGRGCILTLEEGCRFGPSAYL